MNRELSDVQAGFRIGFLGSSAGKESAFNAGDPSLIPGSGRSTEGIGYPLQCSWSSLVAQVVKNLPAMEETWIRFLDWEDPSGGGHGNPLQYSCLEKPPWTEESGKLQSMGSQGVGHD